MPELELNRATAECWYANYTDATGSETIVLELRYTPGGEYVLHTTIRGTEYHLSEKRFFVLLEDLFVQLPREATMTIKHEAILHHAGQDHLVSLDEQWSFSMLGESPSVIYQLSLSMDGQTLTSPRASDDMTFPLGWLIVKLNSASYFKCCAFCDLRFEDDIYGGSDGHRDLMYCFRDQREVLDQVRAAPHKSVLFPRHLLALALPNVDAFHSCSAFTLKRNFNQHIEHTRRAIEYDDIRGG